MAQLALRYAKGGCAIHCVARGASGVHRRLDAASTMLRRHELASTEQVAPARAQITVGTAASVDQPVDLIVESLPEDLELKIDRIGAVVSSHPDAVIASNTSSLSVTVLGLRTGTGRLLGAHHLNPPLLLPLVEFVAGAHTDPDVLKQGLARRWRSIGPFATAALGGGETFRRVAREILPESV